jgi:tetratricopeptide (TPR) repeat protein
MALMIYQKIIETNPDYIRAYIQKATLYMHLEDYLNCAKIFKKVLKFNSEYYRAYLAIGICYEKLGNIQGARRFYKKYLKYSKDVENIKEVSLRIKELNGKIKKEVNNLKLL